MIPFLLIFISPRLSALVSFTSHTLFWLLLKKFHIDDFIKSWKSSWKNFVINFVSYYAGNVSNYKRLILICCDKSFHNFAFIKMDFLLINSSLKILFKMYSKILEIAKKFNLKVLKLFLLLFIFFCLNWKNFSNTKTFSSCYFSIFWRERIFMRKIDMKIFVLMHTRSPHFLTFYFPSH